MNKPGTFCSNLMINKLITGLLCLLCSVSVSGYDILPAKYDGSMMPYDFSRVDQPEWSDTLSPRFCAYIARHGSRYMTSEHKFSKLEKALKEAQSQGSITPNGKVMLQLLQQVRTVTGNRWGELSEVGVEEERKLGEEMMDIFKPLSNPSTINTISSFVPRAEMTMYQFNHSLLLRNDSITTYASTGHEYSRLLYCFAYDQVYADYRKDGDWKEYVERYEEDKVPIQAIARLLGREVKDSKKARELTLQLYSVLQSLRAIGLGAPTTQFMSEKEYRQCWQVSNYTHYLRNNVSSLDMSCVSATAPLIESIITSCDTALTDTASTAPIQLKGWFGHAETLLPLLSVLQIPGCFSLPATPDDLEKNWQLQEITPLGANFALYIFRGPSGRGYMAGRLNGRNVELIEGRGYLLPWDEVKEHWEHLLISLRPRMRR